MLKKEADDYRSYLLRMWRTRDNDTFHWRISLERVDTGERVGFDRLEALIEYLLETQEPPRDPKGFRNDHCD